jgi:hypothetical protein
LWWPVNRPCWRAGVLACWRAGVLATRVLLKDFPVVKDFQRWSDKILHNQKNIR